MTLRFALEAEEELAGAAEWYETRRAGLGAELIAVVDRAIATLSETPSSFPLWQADRPYRQFVLQRFPFIIFFVHDDGEIVIVAVAHTRRRPLPTVCASSCTTGNETDSVCDSTGSCVAQAPHDCNHPFLTAPKHHGPRDVTKLFQAPRRSARITRLVRCGFRSYAARRRRRMIATHTLATATSVASDGAAGAAMHAQPAAFVVGEAMHTWSGLHTFGATQSSIELHVERQEPETSHLKDAQSCTTPLPPFDVWSSMQVAPGAPCNDAGITSPRGMMPRVARNNANGAA